jgi:hypothetical protein
VKIAVSRDEAAEAKAGACEVLYRTFPSAARSSSGGSDCRQDVSSKGSAKGKLDLRHAIKNMNKLGLPGFDREGRCDRFRLSTVNIKL